MIRDRGTIKWTSLMLPEHVALLKSMWQEDQKIEKPTLDSQQIELFDAQLLEAYERRLVVSLSTYSSGTIVTHVGTITKLDNHTNNINLQLINDERITIAFRNILSISIK